MSIKEKNVSLIILAFFDGLVSICIKNLPSLLTGGKGWYYYHFIFDYFGVFWASEQSVFRHTVQPIMIIPSLPPS